MLDINLSTEEFLVLLLSFGVISLAALNIGRGTKVLGFPMISGFILTGVLVGPFMLGFVPPRALDFVKIIDSVALPFIAFAAGAELHISHLKKKLTEILTIIALIIAVVMTSGSIALFILADYLPFMSGRPSNELLGIALLGGSILVAKSPSSLVAIIKELRAKGPYVQTALGVTVLMDAIVIILFAITNSIADVLFVDTGFNIAVIFHLTLEIALDVVLGIILAQIIRAALSVNLMKFTKGVVILALGYSISALASALHNVHLHEVLPIGLFTEPLLICMVAGLYLSNFTKYSLEFEQILEDVGPVVFLFFFTALGVSLNLSVLRHSWIIALILVAVRATGMATGCYLGSTFAGYTPVRHRKLIGMAFITQAGISLSLAKGVASHFPDWGPEFATLMVGVIVVNTILGPGATKLGIQLVGESHGRAKRKTDAEESALIVGADDQALAVYRLLVEHGWRVVLADTDAERAIRLQEQGEEVRILPEISEAGLVDIRADRADTIVCMLDNDSNFEICELAYEKFGTAHLIVRLLEGANATSFQEMGVTVVDPSHAVVNLLEQYVRSPSGVSLLLGAEKDQDIEDFVVRNRSLHGLTLRELHFPTDILILAIRRKGHLLLTHGFTAIKLGDEVTVVGSRDSLKLVQMQLEGDSFSARTV